MLTWASGVIITADLAEWAMIKVDEHNTDGETAPAGRHDRDRRSPAAKRTDTSVSAHESPESPSWASPRSTGS